MICPSFTFFATAGCVARLGAIPVFVNIDGRSFNIDPNLIERKITKKTRAILPVHLSGQVRRWRQSMIRRPPWVDGDRGCRPGHRRQATWQTRLFDGIRRLSQLYPTKNLGAFGDAGAICTNDDKFAETCRVLRVHGSGHTYHHILIGGMFRLAAIQAAVLSVKLKYLDGWHEGRAAMGKFTTKCCKVRRHHAAHRRMQLEHLQPIRDPRSQPRCRQAEACRAGDGSAVYYSLPLHQQECFGYLGYKAGDFPATEKACTEGWLSRSIQNWQKIRSGKSQPNY